MTLAKAKVKTNETFIVQTSLTIITYDRKNMFIVQATEGTTVFNYKTTMKSEKGINEKKTFVKKCIVY